MKAKLLVAILAFFMSAAVVACPVGQFSPDTKFNWLVGGQFNGLRVAANGTGLRSFVRTSTGVARRLTSNQVDLDRWVVAGGTKGDPLFKYTGTGTRGFVGAIRDARSLFVPVRRVPDDRTEEPS